jgi:hypothetical protein
MSEFERAERDLANLDFDGAHRHLLNEMREHPGYEQQIIGTINRDQCGPGGRGIRAELINRNGYLDVAFREPIPGYPVCGRPAPGYEYDRPPIFVEPPRPGVQFNIRIPLFGGHDR